MTDIPHSNAFTSSDTQQRLRRILDEGPALSERAADHETPPHAPPSDRSISDQIADKSIGVVDEAASHVLAKLTELTDKVKSAEQMVLNSQIGVRETIRAHMRIVEAAAKISQQVDAQLSDAMKPLAALNGK